MIMYFKPEMFEQVLSVKADQKWMMEYVAKTANLKLKEHLLSATIVYCDKDELHFSGVDEIGYTHKGYLIGVEELPKEPCKHEPKNRFDGPNTQDWTTVCCHCGVELVADWKAK